MPNSDESTEGSWRLLRIVCDASQSELIADLLWSSGVSAVEELGADEGRVVLRTRAEDPDVIERLEDEFVGIVWSWDHVPREVTDTWRVHATPIEVVRGHWLVPAWCLAPAGSRAVFIEPGSTFGLGDHPTTLLALRLSLKMCNPGERVHDHGSGSGVLAVSLAAWRHASTSADDIDPDARTYAEDNARRNKVEPPRWVDGLDEVPGPVDGLVANILAPVLRDHARDIEAVVSESGWVVLSGMRTEQVPSVVAMYPDWEVIADESSNGWTAVALRRSPRQ